MRCGECGSKNLKRQSVAGKSFRWRGYSSVTLSQDLQLLTCQECGNFIIKAGEGKLIDEAIEASISDMLQDISGAWDLKASDLAQLFSVDETIAHGWLDVDTGTVDSEAVEAVVDFIQFYDLVAGFIVTIHDQKLWLKTPSPLFEGKSPLDFMKSGTKNIAEAKLRFDRLSNP